MIDFSEKSLREKYKHMDNEERMSIALDFLRCITDIEKRFNGIKGFIIVENKINLIADKSVTEEARQIIRETLVGFWDFEETIKKIKQ